MNVLALFCSKLGRNREASQLRQRTLEARKRVLGDEHPDTLLSINDLAESYFILGRYQEALQLNQQALEVQKRILNDEHPNTLKSMHNVFRLYSQLGQYPEAIQLGKQTVEARLRILGPAHPATISSTLMLARIEQAKQKKEARPRWLRELSRYLQLLKR